MNTPSLESATALNGASREAVLLASIGDELRASADVIRQLADDPAPVLRAAIICARALRAGQKLLFCGNGGSAADALHLAAEFVGNYRLPREGLPAIALSANMAVLTAVGNDDCYDRVFARQIEALGADGDVLVCISTSGKSANIFQAIEAARRRRLHVIACTGRRGTALAAKADVVMQIPSAETARVQEGYMAAGHAMCGIVERLLCGDLGDVPLPA
ncbi:MAG: D-sedoheptulose-7-phosphate isomerase [Chloroflexota bacterium]